MYRMVNGNEVHSATTDKERDDVERLEGIILDLFPELTKKYFCLPAPYSDNGYVLNVFIDNESFLPVAVGCDDLAYDPVYNKIRVVPNSLTNSPVFNEDELIEQCAYLRKRYFEILKGIKLDEIKKAGGEYDT